VVLYLGCWGISSVGRASALHAEGHRFKSDRLHHGGLAEWFKAAVLKTVDG
jgi:hypothetical protein